VSGALTEKKDNLNDGSKPSAIFGYLTAICFIPMVFYCEWVMSKNSRDSLRSEVPGSAGEVGKLAGQVAACDTDGKDRLISELRDAISARDDFLAVVAHELRNPLTPILLCAQLLRHAEESGNRSKWLTELDRLERLIKHFASRTQMLLEVSRISTGKFQLEGAELNLSAVVADAVNDFRPIISRSGSEMITSIEEGIVTVTDPIVISEIVENLLSNAAKYGQGKPIEFILSAAGGLARIVVRDNGIGIKAADLDRIFGRFERAVRREEYSGFGIGLWLVRNLAESMGGSITVVGNVGEGSVFTVSIPIKAKEIHE
jgi:two-component system OmpR family sensor kinase